MCLKNDATLALQHCTGAIKENLASIGQLYINEASFHQVTILTAFLAAE
jgi:hypothetical protein